MHNVRKLPLPLSLHSGKLMWISSSFNKLIINNTISETVDVIFSACCVICIYNVSLQLMVDESPLYLFLTIIIWYKTQSHWLRLLN